MISVSANIERDFGKDLNYVVTANSKSVIGNMVSFFNSGVHSFCLIGSYGTGKSSFILAMQNCLSGKTTGDNVLLKNLGQFNGKTKFHFTNIVGDYTSLYDLLQRNICPDTILSDKNLHKVLDGEYSKINARDQFWIICIDEFGKVLEHAANNNPEREMYSLQKFCEFVNDSDKNVIFVSTLHQGFGAYSKRLKPEQKQEWNKVKGRITELVFKEPVEQLLNIVAKQISQNQNVERHDSIEKLQQLAIDSKFITKDLNDDVVASLYPLDIFAAYILTLANQKFGQNERTLFMFLSQKGEGSISEFRTSGNILYNIAKVYDYIVYNFDSYLSEAYTVATQISAIKYAIERIDNYDFADDRDQAIALVKVIGLLNIFATGSAKFDAQVLSEYAKLAMGIDEAEKVLDRMSKCQIIRFAAYKSRYILFEGTDVDIELGLAKASVSCTKPETYIEDIRNAFDAKVAIANAYYYKTGTPRYYGYQISNTPIQKVSAGEMDGYLNLVFAKKSDRETTEQEILNTQGTAIAYCMYQNTEDIIDRIFEIAKLNWVKHNIIEDENDRVANKEINSLLAYEKSLLSKEIADSLFSDKVKWFFNGDEKNDIKNQFDLSKFLSKISYDIYPKVPIFRNELINRYKINSTISQARFSLLEHILNHSEEYNLGFPDAKFPPEKTIYLAMLKDTKIHIEGNPLWTFADEPEEESFKIVWNECCDFLKSTITKQRRISELAKILANPPYGMKQGFIDCWLPAFLIIKKDEYALYQDDMFIPEINRQVLELLLRCSEDFYVKTFCVDGVKQKFFEKYREAINLQGTELKSDTFIETIKPFLSFYNRLNDYAKTTKDVSSIARKFRDVISNATDPEETFFEKLPDALGFKAIVLEKEPDAINSFVDVLHNAIRNLRSCYDEFIKLIENKILGFLKIKETNFEEYKTTIDNRFKSVKSELMPMNLRKFHIRLIGNLKDRKAWIESVCFAVLNKHLENIKDSEKTYLLNTLQENLFQLEDYVEMHKAKEEEVVRLHITENKTGATTKQIVLPKEKQEEVQELEDKLKTLLSGDKSVNIAALLKLLKTEA